MTPRAIDRLFERLQLTYGQAWLKLWDGIPINELKTQWAHELASFNEHLDMVAWALEHLPERPPNVIQFKNLCRQAPKPEPLQALPPPKPDQSRLRLELEKLGALKAASQQAKTDGKEWARIILAKHQNGQSIPSVNLRFAREALGVVV